MSLGSCQRFHVFDQIFERITSEKILMIICGKINIDIIPINLLELKHPNAIETKGFKKISIEATRITQTSRTCIDNVIAQNIQCTLIIFYKNNFIRT